MASGDTLFGVDARSMYPAPTGTAATPDVREGSAVSYECLDFDAAGTEVAMFRITLPSHYDGGGVTFSLRWGASSGVGQPIRRARGVLWALNLVALVGVHDLVVVDTGDALLVMDQSRAQELRQVMAQLEALGLERYT